MPSFGGYGKAMGLYLVAALVPLLGGEFLAFIYIQYFLYFFIGGIVAMLILMQSILAYSATSSREVRKLASDMQFPDGTQEFVPILYKKAIIDLGKTPVEGKPDQFRYRYALTDLEGNDWLPMFDHPLSQILPSMDDTPLGALIATVSTQKGTFLPLRYIEEPLPTSECYFPGFLARNILRREPRTTKQVREIYGIMTAAKVKQYKDELLKKFAESQQGKQPTSPEDQELNKKLVELGYSVLPPTAQEVHSMYESWVDYRYKETKTELEQEQSHSKNYQDMLDDHLPITLETAPSKINEGTTDWTGIVKYLVIAGIIIGVALIVTKSLGLW